jgi:ABC-2 type transport system permease protein
MKNIVTLIGKEMRLYFISPVAYVVAMVFLLVVDFLFYSQIVFFSNISMQMMQFQQNLPQLNIHMVVFRPAFMNMGIILLLLVPLLTMRLIAEEKKAHTMELLLTSPLSISEIVFGKFMAAFLFYLLLLAVTLHVPLILSTITTIPVKPLLTAYLGLALMGGVFVAFGLFASTVTENQIVAAVVSFGILIGLWLVGSGSQDASGTPMGEVLNFLSLVSHLDNMVKGLIDTRDLGYFISMILLGLFLSHRVVESTRWK